LFWTSAVCPIFPPLLFFTLREEGESFSDAPFFYRTISHGFSNLPPQSALETKYICPDGVTNPQPRAFWSLLWMGGVLDSRIDPYTLGSLTLNLCERGYREDMQLDPLYAGLTHRAITSFFFLESLGRPFPFLSHDFLLSHFFFNDSLDT